MTACPPVCRTGDSVVAVAVVRRGRGRQTDGIARTDVIDNAFLTGTGLSGALRALEQSFGRDPETMIPDVRYTPNPNDAPGGPLVERADRGQC